LYKDKLPREITEDDLDFDNVFKIYVGVNIFSKDIDLIKDIPKIYGRIEGIVPLSDVPGVEKIKNLRIKTNKMETDAMYDYQNIKEYINELPKILGDEVGAYGFLDIAKPNLSKNNNSVVLVLFVGVIFVCGISIFLYKNKKNSEVTK
jgi:hypothetical protein